jgi:hypothetical protein
LRSRGVGVLFRALHDRQPPDGTPLLSKPGDRNGTPVWKGLAARPPALTDGQARWCRPCAPVR